MLARSAVLCVVLAVSSVAGARGSGLSHQPLPKHTPGWNDIPYDWSPEGRRIVYTRLFEPLPQEAPPHLIELGVVGVDGANVRRLVHQPRAAHEIWDSGAHWSPDGTTIAFTRQTGLEGLDVLVVDSDGGVARYLTRSGDSFGVDWSPDSRLLAFVRFSTPEPSRAGIWTIRPDGTGLTQLTQARDFKPLWAPDGSAIAFERVVERDRGNLNAIYTVTPDGTGLQQIAGPAAIDLAGWSSDSGFLLFERRPESSASSVWAMRRDGTDKRRLVAGHTPSWSPDGTKLLFGRGAPTLQGGTNAGLYVADREGRNPRLIFRGESVGLWSPDSTRVALSTRLACRGYGIYVIRIAGRSARRITNDCFVRGTPGGDRLRGTNERDVIYGYAGGDFIDANPRNRPIVYFARRDDDVVFAGAGDDRVFGRRGRDFLDGGPGRDRLVGGSHSDFIRARDGERDVVFCGHRDRDVLVADRMDVAHDCERIRY